MSGQERDLVDLVQKIQDKLSSNTGMAAGEFHDFWKNLSNQRYATHFIAVLLVRVYAVCNESSASVKDLMTSVCNGQVLPMGRGADSPEPLSPGSRRSNPASPMPAGEDVDLADSKESELKMLKQSLLSTLYFVLLSFPFFKLKYVADAAKIFNQCFVGQARAPNSIVDEISVMLEPDFLQKSSAMMSFVEQCSNIDNVTGMGGTNFPGLPEAEFKTPLSLVYSYLVHSLPNSERRPQIMNTVQLFLKHPGLSPGRLLSLIHMLRQFVTFSIFEEADIVKAQQLVVPFYLWPKPYGEIAKETLEMLSTEIKVPGAAVRRALVAEHPYLGMSGNSNQLIKQFQHLSTVHFLLNVDSRFGATFRSLIQSLDVQKPTPQELRVGLMRHIFSSIGGTDDMCLDSFPERDLIPLFGKTNVVLDEVEAIWNEEDAKKARIEKLGKLKQDIVTLAKRKRYRKKATKPFSPSALPLDFEFDVIKQETLQKTDVATRAFPKNAANQVLEDVIRRTTHQNGKEIPTKDGAKHKVKIGICGGDGTMDQVASAYVALFHSKPELFTNCEVQFYLIPLGENNFMAQFVSLYDGWYRRHIMELTRTSLKFLPGVSVVETLKAKKIASSAPRIAKSASRWDDVELDDALEDSLMSFEDKTQEVSKKVDVPTPGTILREQITHYLREADQSVSINVYQVETWSLEPNKGLDVQLKGMDIHTPGLFKAIAKSKCYYRAFPWLERVEIGMVAETKSVKQDVKSRTAPATTVDCLVRMLEVDVAGRSRPSKTQLDLRAYQHLVISNIPHAGDEGVNPNPTLPSLEVQALELVDAGKKKKKTATKNPSAEVFHVSSLEVETDDPKRGFYIVLDGAALGPFFKVCINPCTLPDSKLPLNLRLMTFFPLDFAGM